VETGRAERGRPPGVLTREISNVEGEESKLLNDRPFLPPAVTSAFLSVVRAREPDRAWRLLEERELSPHEDEPLFGGSALAALRRSSHLDVIEGGAEDRAPLGDRHLRPLLLERDAA
jgi:hypothetical protein